MLEFTEIKETGTAYRNPTDFSNAYANKKIQGLSERLDNIALIGLDQRLGRVTFATTSGGSWPYHDDFHEDQAVFEVTLIGVRDENLEELADLAVAAALEWEHEVVLDGELPRDFHLVGQLWSALMPLLKRERPDHVKWLQSRVTKVKIEKICYAERKNKAPTQPRSPYLQIRIGKYAVNFNRYADEGQILEALRAVQTYKQETA